VCVPGPSGRCILVSGFCSFETCFKGPDGARRHCIFGCIAERRKWRIVCTTTKASLGRRLLPARKKESVIPQDTAKNSTGYNLLVSLGILIISHDHLGAEHSMDARSAGTYAAQRYNRLSTPIRTFVQAVFRITSGRMSSSGCAPTPCACGLAGAAPSDGET